MNKKVLGIALAVLFLAIMAVPVVAVSPKKIPVTINPGSFDYTLPTEFWITEGNVAHGRGDIMIREGFTITGEGISLTGTRTGYGKYNANLNNPGETVSRPFPPYQMPLGKGIRQWKIVIDLGDGNTFEGHMIARGTQWVVPSGPFAGWSALYDGYQHAVLQGTGDYQGWTLVSDRARINGVTQPREAYMLIP